ncbi:MAG: phosphate regulon sensor kinase PhoR [Pseudomonadota bacterium]|jgi:two-component system phosphate regulon sensor histidine kinase PhoR
MLSRFLTFVASLLVGAFLGAIALPERLFWQGACTGLLVSALFWFCMDLIRGLSVLHWLQFEGAKDAPTQWGLWGRVTDRIRRLLRERDRENQASAQRLQQFLSAIQASPNGVLLLDAQDRIEWCNEMAAQHLGIEIARDLAQLIGNLVRDPDFSAYLHRRQYETEVVIAGRDHRPNHPVRISLQMFPYGEGRRLLLTRDITAIEQSEAMRRDFVANVSHEIRTPLTVLAGFVETLQNLPLSEPEREKYLDLMSQQAQRMQTLVQDLLTLSRLEGSPLPTHQEWVPALAMWQSCEAEGRALSNLLKPPEGPAQDVVFEASGLDACEVAASRTELLSAMSNLVSNAIRYTPAGGRVHVSLHWQKDGQMVFAVEDSGPGIAPEHIPRITERFYRVDRSRSRETGGTGLGLAIVKHVVQRHGGHLTIDSVVGQGSRFSFVLPADRVHQLQR